MDQPDLNTERLTLRPFVINDSADVESLAGNAKIARMTLNVPHPYLPGQAKNWIEKHPEGWDSKFRIAYAITINTSGVLIGAISLAKTNDISADLGYWLGEPYWGYGYCTEATKRIIAYAFDALDYQCITARHLAHNAASGRVMIKAGMHYTHDSDGFDRNEKPAQFKHYCIEAVVS